jgi:hypothetical protein
VWPPSWPTDPGSGSWRRLARPLLLVPQAWSAASELRPARRSLRRIPWSLPVPAPLCTLTNSGFLRNRAHRRCRADTLHLVAARPLCCDATEVITLYLLGDGADASRVQIYSSNFGERSIGSSDRGKWPHLSVEPRSAGAATANSTITMLPPTRSPQTPRQPIHASHLIRGRRAITLGPTGRCTP